MVKRRIRLHSDTAGTPNFDTALVTELGAVTRRVDGLRAALEQAERKQKLLQELVALEKPNRAATITVPQESPVSGIVSAALLEGPTTKEALNKKANKLGHEAPGRAVHATLTNYVRRGLATKDGDQYALTHEGKEALGDQTENLFSR